MPSDESAVIGGYLRQPKYRADSADWFHEPSCTHVIQFRGPQDVYAALEQAAERADRSFNNQLRYVIEVCRGTCTLDLKDEHTLSEWRDLIGQMEMQFHEGEEWIPCSVIFQTESQSSDGFTA